MIAKNKINGYFSISSSNIKEKSINCNKEFFWTNNNFNLLLALSL